MTRTSSNRPSVTQLAGQSINSAHAALIITCTNPPPAAYIYGQTLRVADHINSFRVPFEDWQHLFSYFFKLCPHVNNAPKVIESVNVVHCDPGKVFLYELLQHEQ